MNILGPMLDQSEIVLVYMLAYAFGSSTFITC
jgi:hypothetical protein